MQHAASFPTEGSHLERYAVRFNAVEINSSFYRPHQRKTYERWAAAVPRHFRFAVKIPRAISHEHQLEDCSEALDEFIEATGGLGRKLGALLLQLPPSLDFEAKVARKFFAALRKRVPPEAADIACEPRHANWFVEDAGALMARHRIARVAADPACTESATEPGGWSGFIYYRLHGSPRMYYSSYEDTCLATLRVKLEGHARRHRTWCIFDNTAGRHATANALALLDD